MIKYSWEFLSVDLSSLKVFEKRLSYAGMLNIWKEIKLILCAIFNGVKFRKFPGQALKILGLRSSETNATVEADACS